LNPHVPAVGGQLGRGPQPGDVVLIGRAASVQFAATPFAFRVVRVTPATTCDDMVWLDGYELDVFGEAVTKRAIYVRRHGL
jgi:hypothetical protein